MKNKILIYLLIIIPYLLVYRNFFTASPLAWGDAPFFYLENLKELFNRPFAWDVRNSNFGASQDQILWLFLPTFTIGLLNTLFSLSSEVLIRLIFYFPATILAIFGSWIFIKNFTDSKLSILGAILYGFNTYFLLLLDGGQIGVALAYGLFPITCFSLLKLLEKNTLSNFLRALLLTFLVSNVDIRIFILSVVFTIIFRIIKNFNIKNINTGSLISFGLVLLVTLGLDSFWILPFVHHINKLGFEGLVNQPKLISLIDALFIYQPHFPLNEFGKTFSVPTYFLPLIGVLTVGLFILKDKLYQSLYLVFLFTVFLAKGVAKPFGQLFAFIVSTIPFGIAFRDSSKFYIPELLIVGCLVTLFLERIKDKIKHRKILFGIFLCVYFYLLLLIYPAFLGQLTGSLGQFRTDNYKVIYTYLIQDPDFFRTLWFSEKPPLAFADYRRPALSAQDLYKERPFASMITGDYDLFNFLHSSQLGQWFDLLGIKYIFFPEDQRKKIWAEKDKQERVDFLYFIDSKFNRIKLNLPIGFPSYRFPNSTPHIFGQKRIFLVLGGDEIYNQLISLPNYSLNKNGLIFLEDGKSDPNKFIKVASSSATVIFDHKSKQDLVFTFLQQTLIPVSDAIKNQWAIRNSTDYLRWKSELLNNGIKILDYDFNKGVAFSTITNEKIVFQTKTTHPGKYYLALRYTNSSSSAGLKVFSDNFNKEFKNEYTSNFKWEILGPTEFKNAKIEITNLGGTVVLNAVGLIDEKDYKAAEISADKLLSNLPSVYITDKKEYQKLKDYFNEAFTQIQYKQINPGGYKVNMPDDVNWLVFSDRFDRGWELNDDQSLPFYSMINGFYVGNQDDSSLMLYYKPQDNVEDGIRISAFTILILILGIAGYLIRKTTKR